MLKMTFQSVIASALAFLIPCVVAADPPTRGQKPTGMDRLSFLVGDWEVTTIDQDNQLDYRTTSTIRPILGGKALEERTTGKWDGQEWEIILFRTYHPSKHTHQTTVLDSFTGQLDIYEGAFDGDLLRQSNVGTGTYTESGEGRFFFRGAMERLSDDHFTIRSDFSSDEGRTWSAAGRYVYKRQP